MDLSNLKPHEKIILNSMIVAGITMFSVYAANPFSLNILYSGIMAAALTFLTQLKTLTDKGPMLLSLV